MRYDAMRCTCTAGRWRIGFWRVPVCQCRCAQVPWDKPGLVGQVGGSFSHSHRQCRCTAYLALREIPLFWPPFRCFGFCLCRRRWLAESKLDSSTRQTHALYSEAVQLWPIIVKATISKVQTIGSLGLGYLQSACSPLARGKEESEDSMVARRWLYAAAGLGRQLGHSKGSKELGTEAELHLLNADVEECGRTKQDGQQRRREMPLSLSPR